MNFKSFIYRIPEWYSRTEGHQSNIFPRILKHASTLLKQHMIFKAQYFVLQFYSKLTMHPFWNLAWQFSGKQVVSPAANNRTSGETTVNHLVSRGMKMFSLFLFEVTKGMYFIFWITYLTCRVLFCLVACLVLHFIFPSCRHDVSADPQLILKRFTTNPVSRQQN